MNKKITAVISVFAILCTMCVNAVYADSKYIISTADELRKFAEQVNSGNNFSGAEIELVSDIRLNYGVVDFNGNLNEGNFSKWTAIGTEKNPFSGSFNGNGHTITGIYIDTTESYQGLFGVVSGGTVYNVYMKDGYINASDHAGAIVGYAQKDSIISSCHNDNCSIKTKNRSGGIVGWSSRTGIYNCSSNGYCYSNRCSGGIVGDVYSGGALYNCYNGGVVDGKELVGGISGGTTSADIQNCINVGSVLYSDGYLVAGGGGSRTITNCFAVKNDELNTNLTIGTNTKTGKTFKTPAAVLDEAVIFNDVTYEKALDALNAWVSAQDSDIYYSPWEQTSMYPYLRDGVISAVRTSYGSETSEWSNENLEEAFTENLVPEVLVGEDLTEKISRGEFAAVAVKLYEKLSGAEVKESYKKSFEDITGDLCEEDIKKASALDIVQGMSDELYEPDTKINREQLATMLCRTIKKYSFADWTYENDNDYYLDTSGVTKFKDDGEISDWAKPSVYYMVKVGVIKGISDEYFAPKNTTTEQQANDYATATREQALVMALRVSKISDLYK